MPQDSMEILGKTSEMKLHVQSYTKLSVYLFDSHFLIGIYVSLIPMLKFIRFIGHARLNWRDLESGEEIER